MELIKLENITKHYGSRCRTAALQGFSCSIDQGEMVAIIGRSGSGKSTVLNLISGIDRLETGNYYFQGKDMAKLTGDRMTVFRRDHIGFVLQHFALIPDYTIFENIAFPLRLMRRPGKEVRERVYGAAREFGIEQLLAKYPGELSGGEAQRAAVARAIIRQPELILADEPTGALDEENSRKMMAIFRKLNRQGITIVIVTHDMGVAEECTRMIQIRDGKNVPEERTGCFE